MKFILKEIPDSLLNRLRKAKKEGIKKIAEIDMLLSVLLFNLEEKSNYFSLCKAAKISPYGSISKKLLLKAVDGSFKEEVEKGLNKIRNKDETEFIFGEEKIKARDRRFAEELYERNKKVREAVFFFVKFLKRIEKSYAGEESYIEKAEKKLSEKERELFNKIIIKLNSKKGKERERLEKAFLVYYEGLKQTNFSLSFLLFWIAIEVLIKQGNKMSNEKILERVSSIYNKELYGSLKLLYKKRNRLVHSYEEINQDERNLMKSIAETVLLYFIVKN